MESEREALEAFYRRYLACCNDRRFDDLVQYVDEDVKVNGEHLGREAYIRGILAVAEAFPDYHWDLQHLLVDGDRLCARLIDTGTHTGTFLNVPATGRFIRIQELAMYSIADGRITECWGDLGPTVRDHLTWGSLT